MAAPAFALGATERVRLPFMPASSAIPDIAQLVSVVSSHALRQKDACSLVWLVEFVKGRPLWTRIEKRVPGKITLLGGPSQRSTKFLKAPFDAHSEA